MLAAPRIQATRLVRESEFSLPAALTLAGNGFHPSWGNYGNDSNGECAVPVYHRFHMPDNGLALFWFPLLHVCSC